MKCIVTGGAGFIGSHLADELIKRGHEVVVIDNLISGFREYINPKSKFIEKDVNNISTELNGAEVVYHFAADPNVRFSADDPKRSFDRNVRTTFKLLEECRKKDIKKVVFASTSTVYGEVPVPTPETELTIPISNYGASKLACESYISSFSHSYGIKGTSLRYANIFGDRSTHGVMHDFYNKLKENPHQLEILGNGKQDKSYLYINDCVEASLFASDNQKSNYDFFNIGSSEKVTVDKIAKLMCKYLKIQPEFEYTGGERGWVGDVRIMLLSIKKLEKMGWKPKIDFETGLKRYLDWLKKRK